MHLINYSARGWESWGLDRQPLIRNLMPVLVDDDLRFEDAPDVLRPAAVANRWLRELPLNGAPAQRTWRNHANTLCEWMSFVQDRGVHPLGERQELRAALSMYAEYRLAGPVAKRWDSTTWNLHVGHLSAFYKWARAEGLAQAVPFTYRMGKRIAHGVLVDVERNLAPCGVRGLIRRSSTWSGTSALCSSVPWRALSRTTLPTAGTGDTSVHGMRRWVSLPA